MPGTPGDGARFRTRAAAERLAERVRAALLKPAPGTFGGIDLKNWTWTPGPTQVFSDLQKVPTAVPYNVED